MIGKVLGGEQSCEMDGGSLWQVLKQMETSNMLQWVTVYGAVGRK